MVADRLRTGITTNFKSASLKDQPSSPKSSPAWRQTVYQYVANSMPTGECQLRDATSAAQVTNQTNNRVFESSCGKQMGCVMH